MRDPFFLLWLGLVSCALVQWVLSVRILSRLRSQHPEIHAELGKPDWLVLGNSFDSRSWRFLRFTLFTSRRRHSDADLARTCWAFRAVAVLIVGLFAALWSR